MGINRKLWLSPTVYNSLQSFAEFKADFHHVYIRARKGPVKKWNELSYLTTNDVIFDVIESWPPEWCTPAIFAAETEKFVAQQKKEEAKLQMAQLAKKTRKKAASTKAQEAQDVVKSEKDCKGRKFPSPKEERKFALNMKGRLGEERKKWIAC